MGCSIRAPYENYYKKFGRYPTRLEDLENTNNQRYLRKRYKDPITGKDFSCCILGEVQMAWWALPSRRAARRRSVAPWRG